MADIKKVSDQISVSGQPTPETLQQAAQHGFQSVLNLRAVDEATALANEQQEAESVGLAYANVPLPSALADEALVNEALQQLEGLPKPVLIHCGAGLRAGAIALIASAKEQGWTVEQLTEKAHEIGLTLEQPHLQQFIQQIDQKSVQSS